MPNILLHTLSRKLYPCSPISCRRWLSRTEWNPGTWLWFAWHHSLSKSVYSGTGNIHGKLLRKEKKISASMGRLTWLVWWDMQVQVYKPRFQLIIIAISWQAGQLKPWTSVSMHDPATFKHKQIQSLVCVLDIWLFKTEQEHTIFSFHCVTGY